MTEINAAVRQAFHREVDRQRAASELAMGDVVAYLRAGQAITAKAMAMRSAIDKMELALIGMDQVTELPEKWGDPRHPIELGVNLRTTCGEVYRVVDAWAELNRIINSPDFEF